MLRCRCTQTTMQAALSCMRWRISLALCALRQHAWSVQQRWWRWKAMAAVQLAVHLTAAPRSQPVLTTIPPIRVCKLSTR